MVMIFSRANERRHDVGAEHVENCFDRRKADIHSSIEAGKFAEAVLIFSSLAETQTKSERSKNGEELNDVVALAQTIISALKAKLTTEDNQHIALSLLRLNQILEDLPDTETARADILDAVGSVYLCSKEFSAAADYLETAVSLIELTNSTLESKVQIYCHLFTAYYRLGELKQAVRYGEQAVTYGEQMEIEEAKLTLTELYTNLAHCEEVLHRMHRARKWVMKATQLRSTSDFPATTRIRGVSQSPNNSPQSSPEQPSVAILQTTMRMTQSRDFSNYVDSSRDSGNAPSDRAGRVTHDEGLKTVRWAQDWKESSEVSAEPGKSSEGKTQTDSLSVNSRKREFTFGKKETIGSDAKPSSSVFLSEPQTAGIDTVPGKDNQGFKRRTSLRLVNTATTLRAMVTPTPILHQCWKRLENGLFVHLRIALTQSNHWKVTMSGSDKKVLAEESLSPKNVYRRMTPCEFASVADIDSTGKLTVPKGGISSAQIQLFRTNRVFAGVEYDLRFSIDQKLTVLLIEAETSRANLKRNVLNDIDLKSREELTRFVKDALLPRIAIERGKIEIQPDVGENPAESSFQRAAHLKDRTRISTFSEAASTVHSN